MTAVPATLRLRREGVLRSRAARGDATAFAAVYERHHQALYRYCRSILRHEEDAQDALQNTFARAFAALQDEQRDFELRPWLFRIAHNEAISILRRRRETSELGDLAGDDTEMEERVSEREELRVLRHDLADLPDRQRCALVLRELNGLSHAEIGTVLEMSPAAVKQAIFEARTALFSCREGREMACHDVRRMLSDGDGRILRGRGVRAHLRSCPDCRRFKSDLEHRPAALRMLAPPLPAAGAATLLSQLLGGPTAIKLLACVAIAGGGTTVAAVEMHDVPKPQRDRGGSGQAAREEARGRPRRAPRQDERAAAGRARPVGARQAEPRRSQARGGPAAADARSARAEAGRGRAGRDGRSAGQAGEAGEARQGREAREDAQAGEGREAGQAREDQGREAAQAGEGDAARPGQEGRPTRRRPIEKPVPPGPGEEAPAATASLRRGGRFVFACPHGRRMGDRGRAA